MNIDLEFIVSQLVRIATTPSPVGYTALVIEYLQGEFDKLGLSTRLLNKGGLLATLPGKSDTEHRLLSAHVDTLGGMIQQIKGNGRLKFAKVGGYTMNSVEGEHCTVITAKGAKFTGTILTTKQSVHVYGPDAGKQERSDDNMEIRLDAVVKTKDDVIKLGIGVGDYVSLDPRTTVTDSGFVKSRHLDDKASVAVLLGVAKYFADNKLIPARTTHFFVTNFEETGHGASVGTPLQTTEFLAVDMGCIGEGLSCSEYDVSICAKDSSGPYDYALRQQLVALAEQHELPYAVDIYPFYGSDAGAALRAGADVRTALIGPGVDASHAHERTHKSALEATAKLCVAYLLTE
ncbi:MAG: putative aminopeptidase YsdC [Firmicutes bacterium]|nr:putative aminopeptidase YsdC [candidate division NPL-UPA2 bacterium]MBT9154632.1 putative aminopeptidase YsdC [candidate division NPL-UPA2 bacterium]